jgi:methionyl-tRNA synthetase
MVILSYTGEVFMEFNPIEYAPMHQDEQIAILVAWPYANGPRHLGHGAALVPGDILARYFRSSGANVLMVSGTDEHGTPNVIAAEQANTDPATFVQNVNEIIRNDFEALGMSFDWFTRTSTECHQEVAQDLFKKLVDGGFIEKGSMLGAFDSLTSQALPDRYVEGDCPGCGTGSRGDQCEGCNTLLDPQDLINPVSKVTGNPVTFKDTEHYFLMLDKLAPKVRNWLQENEQLRPNARALSLAMTEDLRPRAITRDMSWGIPLPEGYELSEDNDKVLYVWFEAVIGYLSASIEWSEKTQNSEEWKNWWFNDSSKHYYVMGKDNVPFHTIIWPAIIAGAKDSGYPNLHYPDTIASTEYLTFKNDKFSSSRGNVLYIEDLTQLVGPDALRYYLIAGGPETHDVSFSTNELIRRTNGELIAKWGNLVSRTLSLLDKQCDGALPRVNAEDFSEEDVKLFSIIDQAYSTVGKNIAETKFAAALRDTMNVAATVNKYIYDQEPWKLIKVNPEAASKTLYVAATAIQNIAVLLSPFLPHSSQEVYRQLGNNGTIAGMPHSTASNTDNLSYALTGDYYETKNSWSFTFAKPGQTIAKDRNHLFHKLDEAVLEEALEAILKARQASSK